MKTKDQDIRLSAHALKIHDQWLIDNGYKPQATSHTLTGPRYKSSDYKQLDELTIERREEKKRINKFRKWKQQVVDETVPHNDIEEATSDDKQQAHK